MSKGSLTQIPTTMKAAARYRYGQSDVVEVVAVPVPVAAAGSLLIKVEAAALNPLDWHMMTGTPWIVRSSSGVRKPKHPILGVDVAGTVAAIGASVAGTTDHEFAVGDEVVGVTTGAFAEYAVASPSRLVHKPAGMSFADAMGAGVGAITALQGLRDKAQLEAGQRLLINGSSGGVGTAAVQLGVWIGAEVTAVCSTRNVELVRSLGAHHVVDYKKADFTETDERYDVFFDNQGNHSLARSRRLLTDNGLYLLVGGPKKNRLLGPAGRMLHAIVQFQFTSQRAKAFVADERKEDLQVLVELMEAGHLRAVIDSTHPLEDIRAAIDILASGRARGKIVIKP